MEYKRQESFRYTFPKSIEAIIALNSGEQEEQQVFHCTVVNMSPSGMNIFSEVIPTLHDKLPVSITVETTLIEKSLQLNGKIIWERPHFTGKQFGIILDILPEMERRITIELQERKKIDSLAWKK